MSVWDFYERRYPVGERSKKEHAVSRAKDMLRRHFRDGVFFSELEIDGKKQSVSVISGDAKNIKTLCSLPDEPLRAGAVVLYEGYRWIITEVDASRVLYSAASMQQSNLTLRRRSSEGEIIEVPAIIEDATTYLSGEKSKTVMTVGDGRFVLTVPRCEETLKLKRGNRFIISDSGGDERIALEITKTNQFFSTFERVGGEREGIFRFVLMECAVTDRDDLDSMVADFGEAVIDTDVDFHDESVNDPYDEKKMWL